MTHQKVLKTGIIAAILLFAAILTTTTTTANVQAKNAGEAGYAQGKNDKQDGQSHNPRCPDGLTDAQCGLYRAGYDAGWVATSIIRPDDEPQREFNFDEDRENKNGQQGTQDDGEFVPNDD